MKRSILGLLCCTLTLSLIGGVATAEEGSTNALTSAINSPVKAERSYEADAAVVRSAPYPGVAAFGIAEDTTDESLFDLVDGNVYQYSKDLTLLGTIAVPSAVGFTSTGIAYDHNADTFWYMNISTATFVEIDKTGAATGNSFAYVPVGGALIGPATIDPADATTTIWCEDIVSDGVFQTDLAGTTLASHSNPDGAGGAFGNGLSYDAHDSFGTPGNLTISSGTAGEGQVTRLSSGQPSAGFPRAYAEFLDVSAISTFINGIQDTTDAGTEVVYLVDNAGGAIVEVQEPPAILSCAPGSVNLGEASASILDDMESGVQPFWNVSSTGFGLTDWAIVSSANARSGTQVWFVPNEATISDKFLDLTVDIPASDTTFEFFHSYDMETGFDGGVLELSTDGGATFSDLGPNITEGGYTGTISTAFGNPIGGQDAWTGAFPGAMTRVAVDLSANAGALGAIIRFRHASDSSVSDVGWEIDDVGFSNPADPCTGGPRADVLFVNRVTPSATLIDDMESGGIPGWGVSSTGFGLTDWAIVSSANARSGTQVWFVPNEATISDKFLDLTVDIPASGETTLEFFHSYDMETGFDGGVLELSTDGGATFADLEANITEGGYTGTISTAFGNPIGGQNAWTGAFPGAMTRVQVDLSANAGALGAILRWRHASDSSVSDVGWEIDDVSFVSSDEFAGTGGDDFTITEFGQSDPITVSMDEPPSRQATGGGTDACL